LNETQLAAKPDRVLGLRITWVFQKVSFELDEVVLYCSCLDELTSARVALKLKRHGVGHVRPLEGGFPKWKALGMPITRPDHAFS